MTDPFPAFPIGSRAPAKLTRLVDGKGYPVVTLTLKEVHAGGEAGRQQLTDFVAEHRLGYWHDPFRDEWRISRPTTANLFARNT